MSIPLRAILGIASLVIAFNLISGLLLEGYRTFNLILTTTVCLMSTCLLLLLRRMRMADAYKIAGSGLILASFLIEFILGAISPARIRDNPILLAILALLFISSGALIAMRFLGRTP